MVKSLCYPDLNAVYFTTTPALGPPSRPCETARFYWKAKGKPDKVIGRWGYHGVTLAAMSVTDPLLLEDVASRTSRTLMPPTDLAGPLRDLPEDEFGIACANLLEQEILKSKAPTSHGGVIVPPSSHSRDLRPGTRSSSSPTR